MTVPAAHMKTAPDGVQPAGANEPIPTSQIRKKLMSIIASTPDIVHSPVPATSHVANLEPSHGGSPEGRFNRALGEHIRGYLADHDLGLYDLAMILGSLSTANAKWMSGDYCVGDIYRIALRTRTMPSAVIAGFEWSRS